MDIEFQVPVAFERTGDRVGLHHVEGDADGEDEQHREHDPTRLRSQALLDVIRRSAPKTPIGRAHLEYLRQRCLDERRGHADQRDHPHPENPSGSAGGQCDSDPGDVAGAHPGREPDGERLETGDASLSVFAGAADDAPHPRKEPNLDELRSDREIDTAEDEHIQYVRPELAVDRSDQIGLDEIHRPPPK